MKHSSFLKINFSLYRFLKLRLHQIQNSITLDTDIMLTSSFVNVALKLVYLTPYKKIATCD